MAPNLAELAKNMVEVDLVPQDGWYPKLTAPEQAVILKQLFEAYPNASAFDQSNIEAALRELIRMQGEYVNQPICDLLYEYAERLPIVSAAFKDLKPASAFVQAFSKYCKEKGVETPPSIAAARGGIGSVPPWELEFFTSSETRSMLGAMAELDDLVARYRTPAEWEDALFFMLQRLRLKTEIPAIQAEAKKQLLNLFTRHYKGEAQDPVMRETVKDLPALKAFFRLDSDETADLAAAVSQFSGLEREYAESYVVFRAVTYQRDNQLRAIQQLGIQPQQEIAEYFHDWAERCAILNPEYVQMVTAIFGPRR